jgi:hypothetical protein
MPARVGADGAFCVITVRSYGLKVKGLNGTITSPFEPSFLLIAFLQMISESNILIEMDY